MVYVAFIPVVGMLQDWQPMLYPVAYSVQCGLVCWLLWRYRALTPELTVKFHWLAVPVGVGVAVAWIGLRFVTIATFPKWFGNLESTDFIATMGSTVGWLSLSLRLVGMSVLVPLFEELCIRSLMLRALHDAKRTAIGLVQVMEDFPVIGEWLITTPMGDTAHREPPVFSAELARVPLGKLSVFGVVASTAVFSAHHLPVDWLGCLVCGVAYCLLLAATRHRGLGPVCWAHGITNALLWVYTVWKHMQGTPDWQFL